MIVRYEWASQTDLYLRTDATWINALEKRIYTEKKKHFTQIVSRGPCK